VQKPVRRKKFIRRQYLFAIKDEADFLRFRDIMEDGSLWPSYAEWCENVEHGIAAFVRQGIVAQKIEADPDRFVAWCKLYGRKPDSASRAVYAAFRGGELADAEAS
jgi:hypothetical protein